MKHGGVSDEEIQFGKQIMSGVIAAVQMCIPLEFLCYITIYWSLHEQNKSIMAIVQEDVVKKRTKKNAITLTGQTFAFMIELAYSMIMHLLIHFGSEVEIIEPAALPCAAMMTAAAITSAQILASPALRRFIQGYD